MKKQIRENLLALLLSALGTAFLIYYVLRASTDVVSSDYIRIIDYYLDDVTDLKFLLSWEGISRIPFTFLSRFVNVKYFNYSVFFDKIIGTFGVFIFNFVTVKFVLNTLKNDIVKIITSVIISIVSFSLISWEMVLNGTGYPHLLTCGFIALVFYLFDRIVKRTKAIMTLENLDSSDLRYYGNEKENNRLGNMVALIDTSEMQRKNLRAHALVYFITAITALCFAGSYQVTFLCTLILFSIIEIFVFVVIRNKYNKGEIDSLSADDSLYGDFKAQYNGQEIKAFGKYKGEKYSTVNNETTFKIFFKFLFLAIISLICLTCYFKSNATGEPLIPVGMKDITILELLKDDVKFPLRFLLKSFASSIIGVETFNYALNFNTINEGMIFFIGFLFFAIIIVTIVVFFIKAFTKKTKKDNIFDINTYGNTFPMMYIVIGLANYVIIFLARYKFVRDDYGMSSRYGIQYMFFTIGIILIHAIFLDSFVEEKKYFVQDEGKQRLSKAYLKRKEKLIEEGKMKLEKPKYSYFFIVVASFSIISVSILTLGHITTTMDEIFKADYRKIAYQNLEGIAKDYKKYNDDELMSAFEYHRDVDHIKHAMRTLETKGLNIFRR